MNRSRSILGLMFLSAVCFAAFGASSASAANVELHECKETGGNGTGTLTRYNAGCAEVNPSGAFETVKNVGSHTYTFTSTSAFTLHGEAAGVAVNVVCNSMMSGEGTEGENTGEGATGEGTTEFSGCEVTEPEGCTVAEPIVTNQLVSHTEEMGVKYEPAPEGETVPPFVELNFSNCKNKLVNGAKPVKGTAKSEEETPTTQVFNSTSGSELTFAGHAATLNGSYHVTTTDGTPVALETP